MHNYVANYAEYAANDNLALVLQDLIRLSRAEVRKTQAILHMIGQLFLQNVNLMVPNPTSYSLLTWALIGQFTLCTSINDVTQFSRFFEPPLPPICHLC